MQASPSGIAARVARMLPVEGELLGKDARRLVSALFPPFLPRVPAMDFRDLVKEAARRAFRKQVVRDALNRPAERQEALRRLGGPASNVQLPSSYGKSYANKTPVVLEDEAAPKNGPQNGSGSEGP